MKTALVVLLAALFYLMFHMIIEEIRIDELEDRMDALEKYKEKKMKKTFCDCCNKKIDDYYILDLLPDMYRGSGTH